MRQVKLGATDTHTLRGISIIGFVVNAYIVHGTVNTAFVLTSNVIDFAQISVSCVLKRGGRSVTIFNDSLYPFAYESGFYSGVVDEIKEANHTPQVLVVQTASLYHTLLMTSVIRLHDVICLSGSDELIFEISPSAHAGISTVSNANSWIEWDVMEGIGNGVSIPVIRTESISANQSKVPVTLGDNVVSAFFINKDKAGVASSVQVLENIQLSSDKLNVSDAYSELLAKRSQKFAETAQGQARNQSFCLFDVRDGLFARSPFDVRLHKAVLNLKMVSANVNAAKNWVVYRAYENDNDTLRKAIARHEKHQGQNSAQYSV